MFGLDDWIAHFSDGATLLIVLGVAVVLGLRHATDPDHLAAVTTLVVSGQDGTRRAAARLGLAWGLGHAASLFAFGLPVVLFKAFLPGPVQSAAEASVGVIIVLLAVWLIVRWRRGLFHVHVHSHGGPVHVHGHTHGGRGRPVHPHRPVNARSPLQALGIGVVHGMSGSAGVGVLLLASIHSHAVAVAALGLLAAFTAVSMAILSTGFGMTLSSAPAQRWLHRIAPALGLASLAFGVWYMLGALEFAPCSF